jgi:hypothetical protein
MSSVVLPTRVRPERCKLKFCNPESRTSGAAKAAPMIAVSEVDSIAFLATRAFQASSVPCAAKRLARDCSMNSGGEYSMSPVGAPTKHGPQQNQRLSWPRRCQPGFAS